MNAFSNPCRPGALLLALACLPAVLCAGEAEQLAADILKAGAADKGLCVHAGTTDGALEAALAKASGFYVQGGAADAKAVQPAAQALFAAGVSEHASVVWFEAPDVLPYADNLVNLVVVDAWGQARVPAEEILRVLAPGGRAVVGSDGSPTAVNGLDAKLKALGVADCKPLGRKGWVSFTKPANAKHGVWTHMFSDAGLTYTNDDQEAGPFEELRWVGAPRWGSLYNTYAARVTAGGRIYYKEHRRSPAGHQSWLIARDAYNGFELWRIPAGAEWAKTFDHTDATLCCDEENVYLVEDNTLVAREGASGKKLRVYPAGFTPKMVTCDGDVLIASTTGRAAGLDKRAGRVIWTRACMYHPAVEGGMAVVASKTDLEALNARTGASAWNAPLGPLPAKATPETSVKGGTVYVTMRIPYGKGPQQIVAYDLKNGNKRWDQAFPVNYGILPYANDLWLLTRENGKKVDNLSATVVDPVSGTKRQEFTAKGGVGGHCFPAKGCANFLLYSSSWYLDMASNASTDPQTVRSPCRLGQIPANGLTYYLPHHCDCKVSLRGFLAMARRGARAWSADSDRNRAPQPVRSGSARGAADQPGDWPVYRHDAQRSNGTPAALPAKLKALWSAEGGGGKMTQATSAYGLVVVAETERHRVVAREAATGKERWSFCADGRIEFAPSLHRGLCLFGTGGGTVYALDAASGAEVWRLRAAPAQKYIGEENQFASAWPITGGVLPINGILYFTCGRAPRVDGGTRLFAVEAASGAVRWCEAGDTAADLFVSDDEALFHCRAPLNIANGKRFPINYKAKGNVLTTTQYLSAVAIADYVACVEPGPADKKHIALSDGRIKGEAIAFNDQFSVAGWRYVPGTPGWQQRQGQSFMYVMGSWTWRHEDIKMQLVAVMLAGENAFAAATPIGRDPKVKSELWVLNGADGAKTQVLPLEGRPVYDGLSAAGGRLFVTTEDGRLLCFGE
ncbi:MAG: PQQ-like beta-propeller repeat protein [Planctomycetes bacterium]|nr:PQQ-like beta-propeller repeat protein [Planctomycetota bacterium]